MPAKILIVDDDPTIHKLITRMLTPDLYEVKSVYDASSALEAIRESRPDLVILDLMMPHISGIEVCQQIKMNPETKDIMVLILSAKDGQDDRIKGLEIGADDYIAKPFHINSLVRKIEYTLSKKL